MTPQKTNQFWPPINTVAEARRVAKQGFWAALFVSGMTSILAIASIAAGGSVLELPVDAWSFVDVGLFVAVAVGIYRLSRVAAVVGLGLYLMGQVYLWAVTGPQVASLWLVILIVFAFANSIRGTFAYHRLRQQEDVS